MDERIAMIQDLLSQIQTVVDEIVAEQQPSEEVAGEEAGEEAIVPSMPKDEYLAKPESERAELDLKNVMNRKPKLRM